MNQFDQAIAHLPLNWRSYQTEIGQFRSYPLDFCFFGVPSDALYGLALLERMPLAPSGIAFLAGSHQAKLMEPFVRSHYTQTIQTLIIGSSSYGYRIEPDSAPTNRTGLDYADAIACLQAAHMPQLTTLQLGVWELFCNAHCAYGRLGDITEALAALASVETLGLYGQFDLSRPLTLPQLKDLTIESNDPITWINGGPLTNRTFHHLLESSLPHLEKAAFICLHCDDGQPPYTFPDTLLEGENVPCLHTFEIDTRVLAPGESKRLLASRLGQRSGIRLYLEDDA